MPIKTFFLEPTNRFARSLRRYSRDSRDGICPKNGWYHNAQVPIEPGVEGVDNKASDSGWNRQDPRWPERCICGEYVFRDVDQWQLFTETIYRRIDNGQEMTLRDAPDGAMWYAPWMLTGTERDKEWTGPDGQCLVIKVVGGHNWHVDRKASNCTMPDDNIHKCWVRHGDPRLANLTVDKNGFTCAAGAGSILTATWHGFLRDGMLVE